MLLGITKIWAPTRAEPTGQSLEYPTCIREKPKKKLEMGVMLRLGRVCRKAQKKPVQSPEEISIGRWLRGWREEKFGDTLRGERKAPDFWCLLARKQESREKSQVDSRQLPTLQKKREAASRQLRHQLPWTQITLRDPGPVSASWSLLTAASAAASAQPPLPSPGADLTLCWL